MKIAVLVLALVLTLGVFGFNYSNAHDSIAPGDSCNGNIGKSACLRNGSSYALSWCSDVTVQWEKGNGYETHEKCKTECEKLSGCLEASSGDGGSDGGGGSGGGSGSCGNGVCESGEIDSCPQDCSSGGGGSGKACASDDDCPVKEYCESGKCASRFSPLGIELNQYVAGDISGGLACVDYAAQCDENGKNCKYIAPSCTATFDFQGDEGNNVIDQCTAYMNLTKFEANNEGDVTINGYVLYKSPVAVCPENTFSKTFAPAEQPQTPAANLKRDGSDLLLLYVKDICPAPEQGQVTRGARATFNIAQLIPNPGQVCENGRVVPRCEGTSSSCGFREECAECAPGFFPVEEEPQTFCDGPNIVAKIELVYMDFFCPGVYQECTERPIENPETKTEAEVLEFCKYGCMVDAGGSAKCKHNSNPIITSVSTVPVAKRGETIAINSTGYDPDMVYESAHDSEGESASTASKREKIALGCSSVSTESGSEEEFEHISFVPDICAPTVYRFSNPSCAYKVGSTSPSHDSWHSGHDTEHASAHTPWHTTHDSFHSTAGDPHDTAHSETSSAHSLMNKTGVINIYCRTFDGELWSDEERSTYVYLDEKGPVIEILSPSQGSVHQRSFAVSIKDSDETGLSLCEYRVLDNGVETKPWTERTCSSSVSITIGPGRDCPTQGSNSCRIEARAADTVGNSATASRTFSIRYLYSNITSPPSGSYQRKNFTVSIIDTNLAGTGFSKCEYRIREASGIKQDWIERSCNSNAKITVGAEANCSAQGENVCIVEARAFANVPSSSASFASQKQSIATGLITGRDSEKCFDSQCPATFPLCGVLPVPVACTDLKCDTGPCGEGGMIRSGDLAGSADEAIISGEIGLRMFSIDYTTPYSEILSPQSGPWINANFTVRIMDNDPGGVGISRCEYKVLSKGVETLPWTTRSCGISENSEVLIKLGTDCRNEGGYVCSVQARAFSVSGNEGAKDQRNFSIILSDVILDGFNLPLGVLKTDVGINFSGTPKTTINLPTFRVCAASSTVAQCKNAYSATTQNCGSVVDASGVVHPKPCLCGSLNSYKCEFRCNDMEAGFYYLASGFTGSSSGDYVTNVYTAQCPTFNIALLNEWLARFRYTEQQIFIMKQQTAVLISQQCGANQTDASCTELYYTLGKLTDALNLATNHISFMEQTIQDLSVSKSNMLVQESERAMNLILQILESINFIPSALDMSMEIPNTVRLNETVSIPVRVSKQGTLDVYGKVSCTAAPSSGSSISRQFGCQLYENSQVNGSINNTFDLEFSANKAGLWGVSCNIVGSFRSDCSLSFPLKSISGSFNAIPPIDSYIQNVTISAGSIENNTNINLAVSVHNPDVDDRFGFVGCKLMQPCATNTTCQQTQSSLSICERLGSGENKTLTIAQLMNKVGAWNVASCFVNVSTRSDCVSSRLHNSTNVNKNIVVTPPPISIVSIDPPESQIPFNSNASTLITVQNAANTSLTVFGTCMYRNPLLVPKTLRATASIPAGGQGIINISTKGNETGLWLVLRCAIGLVGGIEDEKDNKYLSSNFTVFIRTVCGNNACEVNETVTNCPADCTSPAQAVCGNTLCEQGETFQTCSSDCPPPNTCTTNADTPGTNSRCLCQNSVIVSCPTGYSCGGHKCISNEPPPECVADFDCSAGEVCKSDKCVKSAQCTIDSQCPAGKICSSGVCVPAPQQTGGGIDSGVILFIIIIIMIIIIPIVIFSYLHRTVD